MGDSSAGIKKLLNQWKRELNGDEAHMKMRT